jgi:hypothetical protein
MVSPEARFYRGPGQHVDAEEVRIGWQPLRRISIAIWSIAEVSTAIRWLGFVRSCAMANACVCGVASQPHCHYPSSPSSGYRQQGLIPGARGPGRKREAPGQRGVRLDAGAAPGLMRCTHCSSAMSPTHTRRRGRLYRYYICLSASRRGHDTCPVRSIAAAEVEGLVLGQGPAGARIARVGRADHHRGAPREQYS